MAQIGCAAAPAFTPSQVLAWCVDELQDQAPPTLVAVASMRTLPPAAGSPHQGPRDGRTSPFAVPAPLLLPEADASLHIALTAPGGASATQSPALSHRSGLGHEERGPGIMGALGLVSKPSMRLTPTAAEASCRDLPAAAAAAPISFGAAAHAVALAASRTKEQPRLSALGALAAITEAAAASLMAPAAGIHLLPRKSTVLRSAAKQKPTDAGGGLLRLREAAKRAQRKTRRDLRVRRPAPTPGVTPGVTPAASPAPSPMPSPRGPPSAGGPRGSRALSMTVTGGAGAAMLLGAALEAPDAASPAADPAAARAVVLSIAEAIRHEAALVAASEVVRGLRFSSPALRTARSNLTRVHSLIDVAIARRTKDAPDLTHVPSQHGSMRVVLPPLRHGSTPSLPSARAAAVAGAQGGMGSFVACMEREWSAHGSAHGSDGAVFSDATSAASMDSRHSSIAEPMGDSLESQGRASSRLRRVSFAAEKGKASERRAAPSARRRLPRRPSRVERSPRPNGDVVSVERLYAVACSALGVPALRSLQMALRVLIAAREADRRSLQQWEATAAAFAKHPRAGEAPLKPWAPSVEGASLDVGRVYCGPLGSIAVIATLGRLPFLRQVSFAHCGLTEDCTELLCAAVAQRLRLLRYLDVSHNPGIQFRGGAALLALAHGAPELCGLGLAGTNVRRSTARSIAARLEANRRAAADKDTAALSRWQRRRDDEERRKRRTLIRIRSQRLFASDGAATAVKASELDPDEETARDELWAWLLEATGTADLQVAEESSP